MTASAPRRQQYRRLLRATSRATAAVGLAIAGTIALAAQIVPLALAAYGAALLSGLASRRWCRLAERSRVGADAEDVVRRELARLGRDGWRVEHSVTWPHHGDIDHVAVAPLGIGFAIETKTRRYTDAHLARTRCAARWLARRRGFPPRVVPVLCVVRTRGTPYWHDAVLVTPASRLVAALQAAADTA
jgi:hypothetical protein